MSNPESLQARARYCAAWSKDPSAARLLRECANRLDAIEAVICSSCHGTGRRWPFVEPGCGAYDEPCPVCRPAQQSSLPVLFPLQPPYRVKIE